MNYELGLERLAQYARDTDWFADYLVYETRLRENLYTESRYGSTEQLRSDRNRIIDGLNRLALARLNISFVDLCKKPDKSTGTAHQSPPPGQPDSSNGPGPSATPPHQSSQGAQRVSPGKVFIGYSKKDRQYLDELRTSLAAYIRSDQITYWDDTEIRPGAVWRKETEKSMQEADLAVLLVSVDFLASYSIMHDQVPQLLASAASGRLAILIVIVRPCLFYMTELARFQLINDPSQPLSDMKRGKRDEVWAKVVEYIQKYFRD